MTENKPLLSICISTYNRCFYLNRTLRNITSATVFNETSDIEIIVSDNGSTDKTQDVINRYVSKYPDKIKSFRNNKNLCDENMEKVLRKGRGDFLKLHNDTLRFKEGSLQKMTELIRRYREEKPVLFFASCKTAPRPFAVCENANDFMRYVSFYCTWIGGFGIWKSDFDDLKDFSRYAYLRLPQTDVLLRLLSMGKTAVVFHEDDFFLPNFVLNKSGYNHAEVFGKNYNFILKTFLGSNTLSLKTYKEQKEEVFLKHILGSYFDFKRTSCFKRGGFFKFTKDYHCNLYFWLSIRLLIIKKLRSIVRFVLFNNFSFFSYYFRKRNKNNQVYPLNKFNISKVHIGNNSTGALKILFHGFPNDGLFIGDNVHIGKNVVFRGAETADAAGPIFIDDGITVPDGSTVTAGTVLFNDKER